MATEQSAGREATPDVTAENALIEWFHGSEKHPYTAPGHSESATDCWHCEEAANVVVRALRDLGRLDA